MCRWFLSNVNTSEEIADGQAADGIDEIGRDLGERFEDEPPLAEPGMRNDESRLVDDAVAEQDEIEIERPRGIRERAFAPTLVLDREQAVQQNACRQPGLPYRRRIQIEPLRTGDAHRRRLAIAGDTQIR